LGTGETPAMSAMFADEAVLALRERMVKEDTPETIADVPHLWASCPACQSRNVAEVLLYDTSSLTCRDCRHQWLEQGAGG